jgi:hypothetical protein
MIGCTLAPGYPAWNMVANTCIIALFSIRPPGLKIRRVTSWANLHPLYMTTIITLSISYSPELWLEIWLQAGTVKFKWWLRSRCLTLSTILRLDLLLKIKDHTQGGQRQLLSTTRMIVCWEAKIQLKVWTPITGLSLAIQEAQAMAAGSSSHYLLHSLAYRRCHCLQMQGTWSLSN